MLAAQIPYVLSHIDSKKNQARYTRTINQIQRGLHRAEGFKAAESFLIQLDAHLMVELLNEIDLFGNKHKYTMLAFDHIFDIIESIKVRFITGGSKSYDIW